MNKRLPLIVAAVLGALCGVAAAQQDQMVLGQIRAVKVAGDVWQVAKPSGQRERLKEGDFFRQGNAIQTAANGNAILLFDNGSTINLQPNTSFTIDEFLRDPFEARKVDYQRIKEEPSRSVTKVKVQEGTVYFDIPKLAKASSYKISNPVGTAGIRGTAGFVAQDSMGVTEGLVQVETSGGQSQSLGAGQSTGFTPQGDFAPPPASSSQNMDGAESNAGSVKQNIPSDAFANAPQTGAQTNLTQNQKESLEQAAKKGEEALVEAVKQIASETPEVAPAAAAAAAALLPEAAPQVAAAAASVVPSSAPAIAGAVAGAAPSQATAIAQSVAQAAPAQAGGIASAVVNAVPGADASAIGQAAQQGAQEGNQGGQTQGGGGGSGGGPPPAMPGGFGGGGGGGGGGGSSGGGSIYGK